MKHFDECPYCKSKDIREVKKEAVQIKHFTDYKIRYQCNHCGKTWIDGEEPKKDGNKNTEPDFGFV